MSKPLRTSIGLLLLITTVSLASCQAMFNSIPGEKNLLSKNSQAKSESEKTRLL